MAYLAKTHERTYLPCELGGGQFVVAQEDGWVRVFEIRSTELTVSVKWATMAGVTDELETDILRTGLARMRNC